MKYLWIVFLIIVYLIWLVYSVKDFRYCHKMFVHPFEQAEEYTQWFIILHIAIPIIASFAIWFKEYIYPYCN